MKTSKMTFAASLTFKPQFPDRTARRSHGGLDLDVTFKTWPSRAAMLQTVDMQAQAPESPLHWRPCVKRD